MLKTFMCHTKGSRFEFKSGKSIQFKAPYTAKTEAEETELADMVEATGGNIYEYHEPEVAIVNTEAAGREAAAAILSAVGSETMGQRILREKAEAEANANK